MGSAGQDLNPAQGVSTSKVIPPALGQASFGFKDRCLAYTTPLLITHVLPLGTTDPDNMAMAVGAAARARFGAQGRMCRSLESQELPYGACMCQLLHVLINL